MNFKYSLKKIQFHKTYFLKVLNLKKLKKRGKLDADENITIKRMKLNTAVKKCIKGEIEDCKTVAALLTYAWYQDSI